MKRIKKMVKQKIAILSDSPFLPTGYSHQAKLLAKHLTDIGHDTHFFANAYNGATIKYTKLEDGTIFDYKIYGEMTQSYFANSMRQLLNEIQPDKFIILLDTFMLFQSGFMNQDTSPAKTFFWFPSDGGGGMPKDCENILKKVDCPVAMAKFGQKQVKDYYNLDVKHIPHGIETDRYYPLPADQKTELKVKYGLQGKYVIGVVARNQPRKNLDRTIKAMKLIAEKIPEAVLFLHMDPNDPAGQLFNLPSLIKKYNLENRVVFSGMQAFKGFPWTQMNEIYNVMDCFLLTTSGEGFGIPLIEAMACKIPVVATDYTTTPEIVINNKAGLGIKLSGVETIDMFNTDSKEYDLRVLNGTMTGSWEVERGFCDVYDCADKIEWLHNHPTEARQMGENGREAVMKTYDWNIVKKQWENLINENSTN